MEVELNSSPACEFVQAFKCVKFVFKMSVYFDMSQVKCLVGPPQDQSVSSQQDGPEVDPWCLSRCEVKCEELKEEVTSECCPVYQARPL